MVGVGGFDSSMHACIIPVDNSFNHTHPSRKGEERSKETARPHTHPHTRTHAGGLSTLSPSKVLTSLSVQSACMPVLFWGDMTPARPEPRKGLLVPSSVSLLFSPFPFPFLHFYWRGPGSPKWLGLSDLQSHLHSDWGWGRLPMETHLENSGHASYSELEQKKELYVLRMLYHLPVYLSSSPPPLPFT